MERVEQESEPKTWQDFVRTSIKELDPKIVVKELKMTFQAIEEATIRVPNRLKEEVHLHRISRRPVTNFHDQEEDVGSLWS